MNLLLISLLCGSFVGLMIWHFCTLVSEVPVEDRSYLDRPPLGFRMVWSLILFIDHYANRWVAQSREAAILLRLKRGGMEFSLTPTQFVAGKLVAAVGFCLLAFLLSWLMDSPISLLWIAGGAAGYFYPELWLKEATSIRREEILRSLPFYLDIITLSVEAGSNLTGGITQAIQKSGESPLRSELNRVLRDIRAGKARADALRDMALRVGSPSMQNIVSGLIQAERTGSSLGPILRAQAHQLRNERFQRAEKQAMEAPVKLLAPLVLFIFPTTFLVLGFLVLSKALQQEIITWAPLLWAYRWPG